MYTGSSIYGLIFLFCLKRLLWYICCFFIIFTEIHTYWNLQIHPVCLFQQRLWDDVSNNSW